MNESPAPREPRTSDELPRRVPADPNRVLIVEDEPAQQRALVKAFESAGITAKIANNGIEAFVALRAQDYSAIVCDLKMPDQSGVAFYGQLEERFPTLASRVVFVTAWAAEPESHEFLEKTGQPYLAKPYRIDELVTTVKQVMEKPF